MAWSIFNAARNREFKAFCILLCAIKNVCESDKTMARAVGIGARNRDQISGEIDGKAALLIPVSVLIETARPPSTVLSEKT